MTEAFLIRMADETFLYFGYGSNMLHERLQARCPSARPIGAASVDGYTLTFSKLSKDGSGKATIEKTDRDADYVYGVLFEVAEAELSALDRCEGYPRHYDRDMAFDVVLLQTQEVKRAVTYIAQAEKVDHSLLPYDWYKALVLAGAMQNGFDAGYIERLKAVESIPDPDNDRKTGKEAVAVLERAKFAGLLL